MDEDSLRLALARALADVRAGLETIEELRAALASEEVRKRILNEGAEPLASTPEQYADVIDREEKKWSALIRSIGLKIEP